jgi:signal transduction histidine kinase
MQLKKDFFLKLTFLRLFVLSLTAALALSMLSLYTVLRVADYIVQDYRYGYLQYLARKIEKESHVKPLTKIRFRQIAASMDDEASFPALDSLLQNIGKKNKHDGNQPGLWIVSETGKIFARSQVLPLPRQWHDLPKPKKKHGMMSSSKGYFKPSTFVIKLDTVPTSYLVSHNSGFYFRGPLMWIQGAHTFITATLAIFFALSLTMLYLRRKSKDARQILARLEAGDLKARFKIKRFDEFGNLMLDFNRMAEQIENLVKRVNDVEMARTNLLQELGHDVRTPLTSLSTSFDTLREHHEELTLEDRNELYNMLGADIRYFSDLLEKLTIIASINVPKYKATTEKVNLQQLLGEEVLARQTLSKDSLQWDLKTNCEGPTTILGDSHLLTRLIRNAFDNASRYANKMINVTLTTSEDRVEITVTDDGPGITLEAIQSFGKRRQRRQVKERDAQNFSLGLGSVIMKTIAEVHNGIVSISNVPGLTNGTSLKVTFHQK